MISDYKTFIFVHIYKNAGTSMIHALEPFRLSPLQRAINNLSSRLFKRNVYILKRWPDHIQASKIIKDIGKDKFNSYFSFAFVRNPWSWQVSLYTFMLKNIEHHQHDLIKGFENFDEYIHWRCLEEVRFQKDFICSEDGTLLVDFVGRFENIEYDFAEICSRIGIQTSLPKKNVSNTRPYQEFYNKKTIELVRRTFKPDIELFNYEFDD